MDFWQRIRERDGLSDEGIELLTGQAERVEYARKELVVDNGETDRYLYFIERGSTRTYVMREERCIILSFAFEGDPATAALGLPAIPRSNYFVQTMESATLIRIPRQQMEELFTTHTELANWGRRITERTLSSHEEYFANFCWLEKGEQYRRMLERYPELLNRIPLKDLASYLFTTPQSLSRIRAGIK